MSMTVEVPTKIVNPPALSAELQAAAGASYEGWSQGKKWPGVIRLHFADGTAQTKINAATLAYANHDPNVLTTAQQQDAAQDTARTQLSQTDFDTWKTNFAAATTLAQIKPLVAQLARVVWMIAKSQGLVTSDDPGE